jgi:hypothetical protein
VPGPGAPHTDSAPYGLDGTSDEKPTSEEQTALPDTPVFREPDFAGAATTPNAEENLSPTQVR